MSTPAHLHYRTPFETAEKLGFGEIHLKIDHTLGLFAIVAVHDIKRGPAIGGCRWLPYSSVNEAIVDALRLARGMSFKSAISDLPHGGAKSVIIKPAPEIIFTPELKKHYFEGFGRFVHSLGGTYITAADSGTTSAEMDLIAQTTPYVSSTSSIGNPADLTARGVLRGIEAAVRFKLNQSSLNGIHIAIQGLGQVGYLLAKLCHESGARLSLSDIRIEVAEKACQAFNAAFVPPNLIHAVPADVFSPCALGAILNHESISQLQCPIIAGSANNQLATPNDGRLLHRLNILYAPDYVINSGGVIQASGKYYNVNDKLIEKKVDGIYDTLVTIFEKSRAQRRPTSDIADELAQEMLEKKPTPW